MDRRRFLRTSCGLPLAAAAAVHSERAAGTDELTDRLNPKIQHARDVALEILQASSSQLERGLQLHRESLVFDAYGFSPRAALDGNRLAAEMNAGASAVELKDLREEMNMTRYVTDPLERREYMDAWRASGVTCVFQNAGEEGQDPLRLLKRLARFTFATDMLREFVSKAATPADILEAKRQQRHCLYFSGNGVPLDFGARRVAILAGLFPARDPHDAFNLPTQKHDWRRLCRAGERRAK